MASGDVVNTAARLQSAAAPGAILVDETTYRATERAIEYDDADAVDAKGKSAPVPVWTALRARARVDVERVGGAALVGREQEVTLLRETLTRVVREREPQLAALVGVPGIGKSRLVFELFQTIETGDFGVVFWRHGRSPPYGEGVTFWALGEMVKAQAGILESDAPEQAGEKLQQAVARFIDDAADAAWIERQLRPLTGLEIDGAWAGDRRDESFAAWRRFLEAIADERPLVLVFEICTGRTTCSSTSWSTSSTGRAASRSSCSRPRAPSSSPAVQAGAAARSTRRHFCSPHSQSRRPPSSCTLCSASRPSMPTCRRDYSSMPAAILYAEFTRMLATRPGRGRAPRDRAGHHRRPPRHAPGREEGARAKRRRHRQGLLARSSRPRTLDARGSAALARTEGVRHQEPRGARSRARRSTSFATRSSATSPTSRSLVRSGRTSIAPRRSGSNPWALRGSRRDAGPPLPAGARSGSRHGPARSPVSPPGRTARSSRRATEPSSLNSFATSARYYGEALALDAGDPVVKADLLFRHARALFVGGDPGSEAVLEESARRVLASGDTERAAEMDALLAELWWHRGDVRVRPSTSSVRVRSWRTDPRARRRTCSTRSPATACSRARTRRRFDSATKRSPWPRTSGCWSSGTCARQHRHRESEHG